MPPVSIQSKLKQRGALIMGIVNTTPDSFSDGGNYLHADAGIEHGLRLIDEGADILDIGGESTRPGADLVSVEQELQRVIPVITRLAKQSNTPISIDTSKPAVMQQALDAGASMINDVNALRADGAVQVAVKYQVPVCLMHMRASPKTMQQAPEYRNVVEEVIAFLQNRVAECLKAGIQRENIIVDPGIGFGKSLAHNLSLLNAVPEIREQTECEVLIGASRKSMIGDLLGREVQDRLAASVALAAQAALNGAKIIRVHDVLATVDAVKTVEAVQAAKI